MTKKQFSLLLLISIITISPLIVGAENRGRELSKSDEREQEKIEREDRKELKDERREATSTKRGTSTEEKDKKRNDNERRTIEAATNILQKTNREILRIKNIIDRLTNKDSVVAELDARGINTTTIKEKLSLAKTLVAKAETDLLSAKDLISNTATSSTPSLKTKVAGVRKLFEQANSNLKLALIKIKEAHKLLREIPGIRDIKKGNASTTASSSSSN